MNTSTIDEFYQGFADGGMMDISAAPDQWGGFSNQLSEAARQAIEASGFEVGFAEGERFLALYPVLPVMEILRCEFCGEELEVGQSGLCDVCQDGLDDVEESKLAHLP